MSESWLVSWFLNNYSSKFILQSLTSLAHEDDYYHMVK